MSSINGRTTASLPVRIQRSIERLLSRDTLIAGVALLAAVALAWAWLAAAPAMPMDGHGMDMAPDAWSAAYLVATFVMWSIMMVAMMLPSAAPMILLHARVDRTPEGARKLVHSAMFSSAYLLVWTGFAALATIAQSLLIESGLLSSATLAVGEPAVAAALLVGAALYQLTPAKQACLDQCRSPIQFIMRYWSPGLRGALRLGLAHGLYCVGCCWGLMLLLFVFGVMNLAWIGLIAAIAFVEKLAPRAWRTNRLIAGLLLAAAAATLAQSLT